MLSDRNGDTARDSTWLSLPQTRKRLTAKSELLIITVMADPQGGQGISDH
jgi:hypothetical protein